MMADGDDDDMQTGAQEFEELVDCSSLNARTGEREIRIADRGNETKMPTDSFMRYET
jgi:hypothetical protein